MDYHLTPLMIQENYLSIKPQMISQKAKTKKAELLLHLDLVSQAADLISDADLLDREINSTQAYDLLPDHGILSTVYPCSLMRGVTMRRINFSSFFGKFSQTRKRMRLLKDIQSHMSLRSTCDKKDVVLDYLPHLELALIQPLVKKGERGIKEVINFMNAYGLTKEDWDAVAEIEMKNKNKNVMIQKNVKASFNKKYKASNVRAHAPASKPNILLSAFEEKQGDEEGDEEKEDKENENENENEKKEEKDVLIKMKKVRQKKNAGPLIPTRSRNKNQTKTTKSPPKTKSKSKSKNKNKNEF